METEAQKVYRNDRKNDSENLRDLQRAWRDSTGDPFRGKLKFRNILLRKRNRKKTSHKQPPSEKGPHLPSLLVSQI